MKIDTETSADVMTIFFFIVSKMEFFAAIEFYTKRDADALEILSGSALIVLPLVRKSRIEVGEHTVTTV